MLQNETYDPSVYSLKRTIYNDAKTMHKAHILVVDDDDRLRLLLKRYILQEKDCLVSTASCVREARIYLEYFSFDAIILDIMMPDENGLSLLEFPHLPPAILLSALESVEYKITGLERGAYDYIVKPFEPKELMVRLFNIIQRHAAKRIFYIGPLRYDLKARLLYNGSGAGIVLNTIEGNLLDYFVRNACQPVTRQELIDRFFTQSKNPRTLDVQINRLRKKIEVCPRDPQHLLSLRGQGYCLQI